MKHYTAGKKASSLKTAQVMVEKIIKREKGQGREQKDRKRSGKGCQRVPWGLRAA